MAFPVAGRLQRVDRIDGVTRGDQRLHPRAPVGLDPDQHLLGLRTLLQMVPDQGVQYREPLDPLGEPAADQQPAVVVFDLDVVMGLSPVIADEQPLCSPSSPPCQSRPSEKTWAISWFSARPETSGTSSHQPYDLLISRRGTIWLWHLDGPGQAVLTRRR